MGAGAWEGVPRGDALVIYCVLNFSRARSGFATLADWATVCKTLEAQYALVAELFKQKKDCPVPLTVRGTQALVSFAPLAFKGTWSFNQPLNKWNVSNVKTMNRMFHTASSFNQPLNNWNVSKVKDMEEMFEDAKSFNQPLNKWNVSKVEDMGGIFLSATSFGMTGSTFFGLVIWRFAI